MDHQSRETDFVNPVLLLAADFFNRSVKLSHGLGFIDSWDSIST